ncbi:MAG TPA: hypothetical protein VII45_10445 [Solirubrobacterales bacterium]
MARLKRNDGSGEAAAAGGVLQTITQVVGLFAGLATVVYLTGAVVLALRLGFEDLPWGNVVSQLPREFLLSIGAGQVLFPALVVGALYGLYRMLRDDRSEAPVAGRWRDGWGARPAVIGRYFLISAVMSAPVVVVLLFRWGGSHYEPQAERLAVGYAVLFLAAIAVHEARAVLTSRHRIPRRWNSLRVVLTMAGVYCVAAIPSMVVAAAGIGLSEAKVCTSDHTQEVGVLVGESGDLVYLGEKRSSGRRLAIFPLSKVEEMFVGPEADGAHCEFEPAPPVYSGEAGESPRPRYEVPDPRYLPLPLPKKEGR